MVVPRLGKSDRFGVWWSKSGYIWASQIVSVYTGATFGQVVRLRFMVGPLVDQAVRLAMTGTPSGYLWACLSVVV